MKTQLEHAKEGKITPHIKYVAKIEGINERSLLNHVASGDAVIMSRGSRSIGIGRGLKTKVNVNLGTSPLYINPEEEVKKAILAEKYGADTISDLSTGGDIVNIRKQIFLATTVPITTVPVYQTAAQIGIGDMTVDDIISTIQHHAAEGVSSVVIHCVTRMMVDTLKRGKRIMGVVSKGGAITIAHMLHNRSENPFFEYFTDILEILKRCDIVLSLGNSLRSGCVHDIMDRAQKEEMMLHTQLAKCAFEHNVQSIIEGVGGHVRADRIASYIGRYKKNSRAPLFVAGPLPTDIAVGYDHIAGCVGASIASGAGADYLCYLTPAEHLGLPTPDQVKEGLIAFKIAAHIGDMVKYGRDEQDRTLSTKRSRLDWKGQAKYAIDGEVLARAALKKGPCSMCGNFCALKLMRELKK